VIVAVLQTSVMPSLRLAGAAPDLMLLVVVSVSLLQGGRAGLAWALAGGLLLGLLSGGPFLAIAISLALVSAVIGVAHANLPRETVWLPFAAGALGTLIDKAALWAILQVSGHPTPWLSSLVLVLLPGMMTHLLLIYPVYWLMRRAVASPGG